MTTTEPSIDITRLEKIRRSGSKLTARCPACHAAGNDRAGDHFFMNTATEKWGCTVGRDTEHRKEIFALVGIVGEQKPDPERDRRWRMERDEERRLASAKAALVETVKSKRERIIARHRWDAADVWEDSPTRIDQPLTELDPRFFIGSLFPQDATVWSGEVFHSGTRHANHFRTVQDWQDADEHAVGPMVSPALWKAGTVSRTVDNVLDSPFVVLDFDGFDGVAPTTPEEIDKHVRDSLALVRWIRQGLQWQLAAIVWTGSKSIHAWFHSPPAAALQSLRDAAPALGVDAGLIGRPEHPCRLSGQRHAKTGGMSRVLWLQNPIP